MRLFNRSDLGRLYLSSRHGVPNFHLVGDGAVDGMTSATTVSMIGAADLVGRKGWTGSVSARPGYALAAAAAGTDPVDLLVLYGNQCDVVQQIDYTDAVLIEGAIFSADTYSALTSLTSDTRNIVGSTHSLSARSLLRVSAPAMLSRLKTFDGRVVAMCLDGTRVYALIAKNVGGSTISLTLAWSDSLIYGTWYTATISGSYVEPATLSPAAAWPQVALLVFDDYIYISTAADILRLPRPAPGVTTVYPAAVRPAGYSSSGSPDQACRVVGLRVVDGMLYAGTLLGQLWRIAATEMVSTTAIGGTLNRGFFLLDDRFALIEDATLRIFRREGYSLRDSGWSGSGRFVLGDGDNPLVATATGEIWTRTGGTWTEGWDFGGNLLALAGASRNLLYAIAVSGAGGRVYVSVTGGMTWTKIGDPVDAYALLPLPDGKCLVGCNGYLAATAPPEQLIAA